MGQLVLAQQYWGFFWLKLFAVMVLGCSVRSAHWCSAGLVAEVWAVIRVGQLDRRGQGMDIWMDLTLALPVFDVASCLTGLGTYLS